MRKIERREYRDSCIVVTFLVVAVDIVVVVVLVVIYLQEGGLGVSQWGMKNPQKKLINN